MPKQTFYNLAEEKREKLMRAVYQELARVPFSEMSINRIVKEAEISRGSFYQYFEDKADLLSYLLSKHQTAIFGHARESLRAREGDLFAMCLDVFDFAHSHLAAERSHAFCENLFSDMRISAMLFSKQGGEGRLEELKPYIDRNKLDIRAAEDLVDMLELLFTLLGRAVAEAFYDPESFCAVRERYRARMTLLRRGMSVSKE